jgi:protein-S-isoprenylcysteine O-methyltransferase Ste14
MSIQLFSLVKEGWLALGVVWLVTSLTAKPTVYEESLESQLPHVLGAGIAFALVFDASLPVGILNRAWLRPTAEVVVPGMLFCFAGWALTIWARRVIGGNWSSSVALKQGHTLTRRGPYMVIRHPIYTGMLVALLGTALIDGHIRSAVGFGLLVALLKMKSESEERLLRRAFGTAYDDYYRSTGALVPRLR